MAKEVGVELKRLERLQQALLGTLEIKPTFLQGLKQPLEARPVTGLLGLDGNALAQVQPLDAADGKRRLALDDHERDDT